MLEVLQFVFSSFWIWLGTLLLLSTVMMGFALAVGALRP